MKLHKQVVFENCPRAFGAKTKPKSLMRKSKPRVVRAWALSFSGKINVQSSFSDIYGSKEIATDKVEDYMPHPIKPEVVRVEIRIVGRGK